MPCKTVISSMAELAVAAASVIFTTSWSCRGG